MGIEFSFCSRQQSIHRFGEEIFDILIIGGGITGAAVARDAVSRGLKVALVERKDFAYGTSSRSSKLIHGGLRYLQNFEFSLVFEALAERAYLLKTVPHLVRPMPFYLPVYQEDSNGPTRLSLGLWLYDLLALFRTPGFHRRLSKTEMLRQIPFLNSQGLLNGFQYFDASMWDDVLAVQILRAAFQSGAAVANYVEAVSPLWMDGRIKGFRVQDLENGKMEIDLLARRIIICAGPWIDQLGETLSPRWKPWLNPSKGVHLIFDLKRIPVPGALVMSHPEDGRIAFVIPRQDIGAGVVIVGTTDGTTPRDPDRAEIDPVDVNYLLSLLKKYFPSLEIRTSDILSAYIGVRPLMGASASTLGSEGQGGTTESLQKISREHHIALGPGGAVLVAGGKYTTHRKMAKEIVDFTLKAWRRDAKKGQESHFPQRLRGSQTTAPVNPLAIAPAITGPIGTLPQQLLDRYGSEALEVIALQKGERAGEPEGFPYLESQLRYAIRSEMVIHVEDFYLRRMPLYASRKDHGLPWAEKLSQIWAEERGLSSEAEQEELARLQKEIERRSEWEKSLLIPLP